MGLKEILNKNFSDAEKINLERYKAAKFTFIISVFIFFINFYLVGANFYLNITTKITSISYVILLLSTSIFIYLFIKKTLIGKVPNYIFFIIFILLLAVLSFLLLPVILDGGINTVLELFNLY